MNQFCVLIFEPSEEIREKFHKLLVTYAISCNTEVLIKWVNADANEDAIMSAGVEAQVAFVNTADQEHACSVGEMVYKVNSNCALIYYSFDTLDNYTELVKYFSNMFPSRPIMYLDKPTNKVFYDTIKTVFEREIQQERFEWETKNLKFRVPYNTILYFRSDRNNVYIHLENGTEYSFYGKLTQIEERLPEGSFVRIHQSYLVNKSAITFIDKTQKIARLRNGEDVYISRAHYKEVLSS